jgi:hypothetical protein
MAIISSGRFVSDGLTTNIAIRSDLDWMYVYNYTTASAAGGAGCQFYWQRGMDAGTGLVYSKTAAVNALELDNMTAGGFTLFDTSLAVVGNAVATTASSNAVQPVISTASTAGLVAGMVVRLSGIAAAPTICGIDFEIDTIVANTSFRIRWPLDNAPGAVGGAGFYRVVAKDPMFLPGRRFVVDIASVGATTVVTTSVAHGYEIGEVVRMYVPSAANGMVEIDGLQGAVTAVDLVNNTFTLDIDSSSFTAFAWPVAADSPYTPAQCMAFGSAASGNLNLTDDATRNIAEIGMTLGGGAGFPTGVANDVIYWVAGKSDQVLND